MTLPIHYTWPHHVLWWIISWRPSLTITPDPIMSCDGSSLNDFTYPLHLTPSCPVMDHLPMTLPIHYTWHNHVLWWIVSRLPYKYIKPDPIMSCNGSSPNDFTYPLHLTPSCPVMDHLLTTFPDHYTWPHHVMWWIISQWLYLSITPDPIMSCDGSSPDKITYPRLLTPSYPVMNPLLMTLPIHYTWTRFVGVAILPFLYVYSTIIKSSQMVDNSPFVYLYILKRSNHQLVRWYGFKILNIFIENVSQNECKKCWHNLLS